MLSVKLEIEECTKDLSPLFSKILSFHCITVLTPETVICSRYALVSIFEKIDRFFFREIDVCHYCSSPGNGSLFPLKLLFSKKLVKSMWVWHYRRSLRDFELNSNLSSWKSQNGLKLYSRSTKSSWEASGNANWCDFNPGKIIHARMFRYRSTDWSVSVSLKKFQSFKLYFFDRELRSGLSMRFFSFSRFSHLI